MLSSALWLLLWSRATLHMLQSSVMKSRTRVAKRLCCFISSTVFMLLLGFYAGRHDLERAATETARCISLAHTNARFIRADREVERALQKQDRIEEKMQPPSYMQDDFTNASTIATRPESGESVVWLYSLITTDYDGPNIIPHFIRHYKDSGIPLSRFYVDLLHDPTLPDDGLRKAQQIFAEDGAHTRTILQPYTPDLQDQAMVSGLYKVPMDIEDWVVTTDMDEFFTFGEGGVYNAMKLMDAEGATFALGEMLDHVAPGGKLNHVDAATDIWAQFPLVCPIVSNIAKGLPAKVTISKAYLRTGAGHHHIVPPHLAHAYFSDDCSGIACELVMKLYKQRTLRDLYGMTPYSQYADRYVVSGATNSTGWRAKQWSAWTKVHHFKWHAAVLDNLLFRMSRDSGDCLLDVNEQDCQPVFQFWREVARQFQSLNATRSIDISKLDCKEGVDTLWSWK